VSDFAKENSVTPKDVLEDGIEFGRRKLEGLASQEHSLAEKNYAEATRAFTESEEKKMQIQLDTRVLESRVRKEQAEAEKAQSEASLARLKVINAEFDLLQKLTEAGMVLRTDHHGNLTVLPVINACQASKLIENRDRFVQAQAHPTEEDDPSASVAP
jgi:predicted HicB family RNase H-like nuclease